MIITREEMSDKQSTQISIQTTFALPKPRPNLSIQNAQKSSFTLINSTCRFFPNVLKKHFKSKKREMPFLIFDQARKARLGRNL
ncbi:Oidioi.mRNA.OKI2018_I69.chr2.g5173.t1.cds [Oikopleura dioica]|uniref:Oidioi.mRNA.OKI2018_I69.chr2.g5163.t1.cds n=1 Tax=Oikopleura dioica TaxID=34765 RepID=A0ABN7T680_OIKDI|nr:Oidioi.mRNA.OKI2018_I69.chr2.g5163.t1.cds [Oikopleura dioica]CAG5110814.1 Oidioi.mRNA.OKI2018_I69.chr2.g5173.t1.cds [Oikopleura dioica]